MTKALDGIRVIDMTHNQAGPACAQVLAWFGADVIKLETPGKGDIARAQSGDELFFLMFNANKRSLTLDLKSDEGKALFRKLIQQSDVLLENFSPGALERMGFGYAALKEINPRLIYATIKGFGTYGPYADFKSFEPIASLVYSFVSARFSTGPKRKGSASLTRNIFLSCLVFFLGLCFRAWSIKETMSPPAKSTLPTA